MIDREAPTDPANEKPDPEEEAFIRVEKRLNELYTISVRTLEAVMAHAPRIARHDERLDLLEAKVKLLESRIAERGGG